MITCASPRYLEKFGIPSGPEELETDHYTVSYFRAQTNRTFPFDFRKDSEELEINTRYIVAVNDSRTYVTAVLNGLGIAQSHAS